MTLLPTALLALSGFLAPASRPAEGISVDVETYTLPNGMTVALHEDHSLPKVVINTWFAVGSKDEKPGRTGFAHLFEHLMFMGTERVPGNQFDVLMETGGGFNNASTSTDRTNYFSTGPSSLLPTLLWLDADRLDALADSMTQEKLDTQRGVVRNERRQTSENVPYGKSWLILPEMLYPVGHPYHHPVIGSHEDLEAATVEDVVDFFRTFYVPANASLVVAGDFDPEEVKPLVARTFGAIPAKPAPEHGTAAPVVLEHEKRRVATDKVEFPRLFLAWHSPAHFAPGDAEMDVLAQILADGNSSRLERRLVLETGLAQDVSAYQYSKELGSSFHVEATAAPGADLEEIKREILSVLDEVGREGPTAEELERTKAQIEASFLRDMESLLERADRINAYRHFLGVSDGFQRDLDRYTGVTAEAVARYARETLGEGRVDLRILPEGASSVSEASLDERPEDFPAPEYTPPTPETFALSNGIRVHAIPRPGSRLFSGRLVVRGGDELVPAERAGLAELTASLLTSGAGGRDASEFAAAVDLLGASVNAGAGVSTMSVGVSGLTSRMDETLDLFADCVLRPNLAQTDFEREKKLQLAAIAARKDDPREVADTVARVLAFGHDAAGGRPVSGWAGTVGSLELATLQEAVPRLLDPANATFVFAGDFELEGLKAALEARFGAWKGGAGGPVPAGARREAGEPPRRPVVVDRPGAPQTAIYLLRTVPEAEGVARALRDCVNTVLGGSFTSRLNQNLREEHAYSYGAGSRTTQEGPHTLLYATSAVFTDKTGPALAEFRKELERLSAEGIDEAELAKAVETLRTRLVQRAETTRGLAGSLASLVEDGRPLDALAGDMRALGEVDLAAANELARSGLFAWDGFLVVLVGDREAILPQLAEAGFPEPLEATPDGALQE